MTAADIEAVRRVMPHADDLTIRRHLQQRAELQRLAQREHARKLAAALGQTQVRQG